MQKKQGPNSSMPVAMSLDDLKLTKRSIGIPEQDNLKAKSRSSGSGCQVRSFCCLCVLNITVTLLHYAKTIQKGFAKGLDMHYEKTIQEGFTKDQTIFYSWHAEVFWFSLTCEFFVQC